MKIDENGLIFCKKKKTKCLFKNTLHKVVCEGERYIERARARNIEKTRVREIRYET